MLLGVWELLHMSLVGKAFCPIDCMIKNEIAYSVSFMKWVLFVWTHGRRGKKDPKDLSGVVLPMQLEPKQGRNNAQYIFDLTFTSAKRKIVVET